MKDKSRNYFRRIKKPFQLVGKWISAPFQKTKDFFLEEPGDAPMVDSLQLAFEEPASFLEHIGALRKHIVRSLAVLLICAAVCFAFLSEMLDFVSQPIGGLEQLSAVDVTEPIGVGMRVVLLAAFAASFIDSTNSVVSVPMFSTSAEAKPAISATSSLASTNGSVFATFGVGRYSFAQSLW